MADEFRNDIVVSLDAIPEPTLRYELRDDEPVVTHTNRAFDATFASIPTGTTLDQCLHSDHVGLDGETARTVCSSLAAREPVDVTQEVTAERTITLQSSGETTGSGENDGILTLRRAKSTGDDPVRMENIATVVSHDLRNPIDVAKANLRAARERGDAEHFDRVAEAHDRMERIIQDVLTLARGDGTVTPTESVAVGTVARDAWSTVDTADASLDVASDLPTVEADPPRLRRLFENLYRNSVEHGSTSNQVQTDDIVEHGNEAGPGQLQVKVGTTSDGGFFVADDGVGIPDEDRKRVFDPGYSSSERGAGLGLTIVERIAEAHGWRVSVPAEASDGARFDFHPRDDDQ